MSAERDFASMEDLRDSETRQDKRLDDILATVRAGNLHLEQHLNAIETRLEGRLDGLESRLGGLESRLDGQESRLDGLESRLRDVGERLTWLEESKRIVMWVIGLGVPILIGVTLILVRLWTG